MSTESVVIIGASHAAAEAVTTLRKKKWAGRIVLIGDEPLLPYQRPPLSKAYLSDQMTVDQLLIKRQEAYDRADVDLFLGRTATAIDRAAQHVVLDGGEQVPYSKLILATGARPRRLPIPGADLPQVNYLRTKQDVDQIKAQLRPNARLLVIGAGYIGLEVAAAAVRQDVNVTVLEAQDRVLARVTSPIVSDFYQLMHRAEGVDLRLNTMATRFEQVDGQCYAVLDSGEQLLFDCVVVGIGVVPNVELAEAAGLPCDNGIIVDQFTQTADLNIYAVGDCCNHPNQLYDCRLRLESVPNAVGQGKTAALAICGKPKAYADLPWFWSDQFDVKLQTAGLFQNYDQAIVRGEPQSRKFSVFYLRNQQLIAVDAINSPAEFMGSRKLIAAQKEIDPQLLADPSVSMKVLMKM